MFGTKYPKKTHTDKERTCKHAPQFRCFYIYQDYVTCGKEPTWVCVSVLHRKIDFFIQSRRHFETSNISFHNKHLSRLTKLTAPPTHKQPPTHNLLESHSILGSCSVWRQSSALFTVISWQHKLSVQCWQGASQWLHTLQENVATNKRFYDHVYAKMVGRKTCENLRRFPSSSTELFLYLYIYNRNPGQILTWCEFVLLKPPHLCQKYTITKGFNSTNQRTLSLPLTSSTQAKAALPVPVTRTIWN